MAHQTSLTNGRRHAAPEGIVSSLAEFGGDMASLAELQGKLALVDLKESVDRAKVPFILTSVAGVLALSALPALTIGLGFLLADIFHISQGWGLIIAGAVVAGAAGVTAAVAGSRLSKCFESFRRSKEEFNRNLLWIRTVVAQSVA